MSGKRWRGNAEDALIDVCIVTHNHAAWLPQCVDSVINQTFDRPYNIYVYDDNSKKKNTILHGNAGGINTGMRDVDGNYLLKQSGIVDIYSGRVKSTQSIKSDSPRQVLWSIRNKGIDVEISRENRGVCDARNHIVSKGSAPWILFVDGDDYLSSNFLEKLWIKASIEQADVVYPKMAIFSSGGIVPHGSVNQIDFDLKTLLKSNYMPVTSLIKRAAFEDTGGFDEDFVHGFEDWNMFITMALQGKKFIFEKEASLYYRHHAEARSHGANERRQQIFEMIKSKHVEGYAEHAKPSLEILEAE